jgi:hypothetical protein
MMKLQGNMTKTPIHSILVAALVAVLWFLVAHQIFAQFPLPLPGKPNGQKPKPRTAEDLLKTLDSTNTSSGGGQAIDLENPSLGNDFLRYYSHGWFPVPFPAHSVYIVSNGAWAINVGDNLRLSGVPRTTAPFNFRSPFANDSLRQPKNSITQQRSGDYPEEEYDCISIFYEIGLPIPAILRVGVGYEWTTAVLFADDKTRSFLSPTTGAKTPVQEIHTLRVDQGNIKVSAGVKIPVRGVFVDMLEMGRISSYYYLYLGAQGAYNVRRTGSQYAQIASNSDVLAFANRNGGATDTIRVWEGSLPNTPASVIPSIPQASIMPEIAIGWGISGEITLFSTDIGVAGMVEAFYQFPTTPVALENTTPSAWQLSFVGLRIAFGWHRGFR